MWITLFITILVYPQLNLTYIYIGSSLKVIQLFDSLVVIRGCCHQQKLNGKRMKRLTLSIAGFSLVAAPTPAPGLEHDVMQPAIIGTRHDK